jgi:hypothetical protein
MALTDDDLIEIQKRNQERKELKAQTTPGKWLYESFAFVDAGSDLPRDRQMCVFVRPRNWMDLAWRKYGNSFQDELIHPTENLSSYHNAYWIANTHNDPVEDDVEALLAEIHRLKASG